MIGLIMKAFAQYKKIPHKALPPDTRQRYLTGYFFLFAFLPVCTLLSQTPDSSNITLPEITIQNLRFEQTGYAVWKADTAPQINVNSLAIRMLQENGVSIRMVAPGALATLSVWGAGPNRSPVLWEGVNLQSPMNGVVDASLIPLWPNDRFELQNGGQSAGFSSGAMGGTMCLEQHPKDMDLGFSGQWSGGLGSFGLRESSATASFANTDFDTRLRANYTRGDNDFPFKNIAQIGQPKVRQLNNFFEKTDIQQFNRLKIKDKHEIRTAYWHQSAFREVPPSMTENRSESWQKDRSNRFVGTWQTAPKPQCNWTHKAAWLDEYLVFRSIAGDDTSRSRSLVLNSAYSRAFAKHFFVKSGLFYTHQKAQVDGYADSLQWFGQQRGAAYMMSEKAWKKLRVSALLRKEWANDQHVPFTWSFGTQYKSHKWGLLRAHISKNFNMPTLNDRYWALLGKPDLLAEDGYSSSAGWEIGNKRMSTQVTLFHLILDNWILWQPGSDGQFRPNNLRKVRSRGLEWRGHYSYDSGLWHWELKGFYQYLKATNERAYLGAENALGKQLPYTPNHQANMTLSAQYRTVALAYLQQFTGHRFTTTDNSADVDGFFIGTFLARWAPTLPAHPQLRPSFGFRVENLWNQAYQVLAFRPLPGRNWQMNMAFRF